MADASRCCENGHDWHEPGAECPLCGAPAIPSLKPASAIRGELPPTLDSPAPPTSQLRTTEFDFRPPHWGPVAPPSVPGYEIDTEIGRGGMGVVYRARQTRLGRTVALKMILEGTHAGPRERERFRREAEAVAALQHPNIVQIFDINESDSVPYLALEYVEGGTLADRLHGVPWPSRDAASLIRELADAIQAAHAAGIVHRDLKPANVLLASRSTADPTSALRAPRSALPKITDFGLAKRLPRDGESASTGPTRSGAVMGTPSYLPPEQASGKHREIGPAADVYALGAILYEMLTGRPPFQGETPIDTLMAVVSEDPVAVRRLNPKVPRDLETVCLKCLSKEPARRYPSAHSLAEDLDRFLSGMPVKARPSGVWTRGVKLARRRPTLAAMLLTSALGGLAVLAVSVGFIVALSRANEREQRKAEDAGAAERRAEKQRRAAEAARSEAEHNRRAAEAAAAKVTAALERSRRSLYALTLAQAANMADADPSRAAELLDSDRCPRDLHGFSWEYFRHRCERERFRVRRHADQLSAVAVSPDGRLIASAGWDGTALLYDADTGAEWAVLPSHDGVVLDVAFLPDGKTVATAGDDRAVRLWKIPDRAGGDVPATVILPGHPDTVRNLAAAPDGQTLAAGCADGSILLWTIGGGTPPSGPRALGRHGGEIWSLAFSPDGSLLASGGTDGVIRLWAPAEPEGAPHQLGRHGGTVIDVAFSPDGTRLVTVGHGEPAEVRIWDVVHGTEQARPRGGSGAIYAARFRPDGRVVATGGADKSVRLWDADTGQELGVFPGHDEAVRDLAFTPDGGSLVSGELNGTVRVWATKPPTATAVDLRSPGPIGEAVISADGRTIAAGYRDGSLRVWHWPGRIDAAEVPRPMTWSAHVGPVAALALTLDAKVLATAGEDGAVRLWPLLEHPNGDAVSPNSRPLTGFSGPALSLAWSADGSLLAAGGEGEVTVWDVRTGATLPVDGDPEGGVRTLGFSPGGDRLAAGVGRTLQLWRRDGAAFGNPVTELRSEQISVVRFSPDGRTVAAGHAGGGVNLIAVDSPKNFVALEGHRGAVLDLCFDGRGEIVTASADREVRIWDDVAGQERAALAGHASAVLAARSVRDPGGATLISLDRGGEVHFRGVPSPP